MDEYIIVNKTGIQKRIEELENKGSNSKIEVIADSRELDILKQILSQSIPLIQEIKEAYNSGFTEGTCFGATTVYKYETPKDYISNLTFDI